MLFPIAVAERTLLYSFIFKDNDHKMNVKFMVFSPFGREGLCSAFYRVTVIDDWLRIVTSFLLSNSLPDNKLW